jgi:CRISPR-associated protein Csb1
LPGTTLEEEAFMTSDRFDSWFDESGPAALVLREQLMPVEGRDGVLFPPTFAATTDKSFKGGYNIDPFPNGDSLCLVDSVGSQANRIEPIFMLPDYVPLVPQITIRAGERVVNLLEAGHRAGDAIIRNTSLHEEIHAAFQAVLRGDAAPLAGLAPTSLVFGVWDSRGTQAKLPRLLASTIRAYNVRPLTRSAQYVPAIDYNEEGVLTEPKDSKGKKAYSERGFSHVPASKSHGGVLAERLRRDATLHLGALRLLRAADGEERTLALRRYVLGLALTAFTHRPTGYLRQGCNLVRDPDAAMELVVVFPDGRREDPGLGESLEGAHEAILTYARDAAGDFGVGEDRAVDFDPKAAQADLQKK